MSKFEEDLLEVERRIAQYRDGLISEIEATIFLDDIISTRKTLMINHALEVLDKTHVIPRETLEDDVIRFLKEEEEREQREVEGDDDTLEVIKGVSFKEVMPSKILIFETEQEGLYSYKTYDKEGKTLFMAQLRRSRESIEKTVSRLYPGVPISVV